jgi:hypothetical protein
MRGTALALATLAALGCAHPAPPKAPPLAGPGLVVTLVWDAPVDLDLYVTEPGLETVYFANRRTARGGRLEADARCAGRGPGPQAERASWAVPEPGRYRVGVDFLERCAGRADRVPFRVVVDHDGRRREIVGEARLGERQPAAGEFVVEGR